MDWRARKQQQSAMEFLVLQEAGLKQQQQMPVTGRVVGWLWAQGAEAVRVHLLPRIPARAYAIGTALLGLVAFVAVMDAYPHLRPMGMLLVAGGGALAGYWRARSRRWICAGGIGLGAAWTLGVFAISVGAGLVMVGAVAVVYVLIGIERGHGDDPGRLVAEWGGITSSPRSPLRQVLEGSSLHLEGIEGLTVSYTLTLASGRTIDEALKVRAKIESAADRIFPVQKGTMQLLADHDSPSTVHMTVDMRPASPTGGGEE